MTTAAPNPFGEEFDEPEPVSKITHDGYGRYNNLPPVPGHERVKSWTRVSTIKGTLPDKYNLQQWEIRQILQGIKLRPELLDQLTERVLADPSTRENKAVFSAIASAAKELAGSHDGADAGTRYHKILENDHAGLAQVLGKRDQIWLDSYRAEMERKRLEIVPEYTERVVVIPGIKAAGRLDLAVRDLNTGLLHVGDLKTQKWEPGQFDGMELACQLSSYGHAGYMLDEESWSWVPMPKFDRNHGAVIWAPATQPKRCEIRRVDLQFGKTIAQASVKVREWRYAKNVVTDW